MNGPGCSASSSMRAPRRMMPEGRGAGRGANSRRPMRNLGCPAGGPVRKALVESRCDGVRLPRTENVGGSIPTVGSTSPDCGPDSTRVETAWGGAKRLPRATLAGRASWARPARAGWTGAGPGRRTAARPARHAWRIPLRIEVGWVPRRNGLPRGWVRLWSRNGKDFTAKFPDVQAALVTQLATDCVLDGELVVWTGDRLDFDALQQLAISSIPQHDPTVRRRFPSLSSGPG